MPYRPNIRYKSYHVSANATKAAAGMLFDGTSNTAITAGSGVQFTIHSIADGDPGWIGVGSKLIVDVGSSVAEIVYVTAISGPSAALDSASAPFTLTATFANNHTGPWALRCTRGTRLGVVNFGKLGSSETLTLYNGHPDITGFSTIVVITPAAQPYPFDVDVDGGLFYTYAGGGAGDITIVAAPIP